MEKDQGGNGGLLVPVESKGVVGPLFSEDPEAVVVYAARLAKSLSHIIDTQKFYVSMQGRKYVKVEGWNVLGSMLGFTPREVSVTEQTDGSFMATVELVSLRTGVVAVQASALCGTDEKRWGNAERYARRSMAITRATGKAYRMAFSWIVGLAGYEPTPAEEMDHVTSVDSHKPANQAAKAASGFDPSQETHVVWLKARLEKEGLLPSFDAVKAEMVGKPRTEVDGIIERVRKAHADVADAFGGSH